MQAARRLFVGRLPRDIRQQEMECVFGAHGQIDEVQIRPGAGPSREKQKIAYVTYETPEAAARAARILDETYRFRNSSRNPIHVSIIETGGRGTRGQVEDLPTSRGVRQEGPSAQNLWAAVAQGNAAEVQRFLTEGGSTEARVDGWTPLMKAAEEDKVEIMELLLRYGAEVEAENRRGRTALSFAAAPSMIRDCHSAPRRRRPTALAAVSFLLQCGADIEQRDHTGKTVIDRAREEHWYDAVTMILREVRRREKDRGIVQGSARRKAELTADVTTTIENNQKIERKAGTTGSFVGEVPKDEARTRGGSTKRPQPLPTTPATSTRAKALRTALP